MDKEIRKFDAEIGKILQLMIHSLYTNKDIFLRELVSNASDACDKLRYFSNIDSKLLTGETNFQIKIYFDKEERSLTVEDNGIGMSKEDLINNLGVIASSGTQKFLSNMTGDSQKDVQLIGQFGVGFYSAFMVASEIKVVSCKAGTDEKYAWTSKGDNEFTVEKTEDELLRGTKIILKLKEGEDDYLDQYRIKHIIKTYSDHISVPIKLLDSEKKEEIINSSSALWVRSKSEITPEQYEDFYHNIAYAGDKPWMIIHNKNEGALEYVNLLFIPTKKPFDLFHPDRMTRVKLYIKKIFITDDAISLIPPFLRFLRGIIDSSDLPLNISRETLQTNRVLTKITKSVTNKVLSELKKRKDNDFESYQDFWNIYGPVLKEGLCEPIESKEKIMELCLFRSVLEDKLISFDDYIAKMPEHQKEIYYLSGTNYEQLKNSPQLEGFIKKNIDVLIFVDDVDNFWVNVERFYREKEIKSVTRSGINLGEEENKDSTAEDENSEKEEKVPVETELTKFFSETLVGKVKSVVLSKKLIDSPVCLTVPEGSMDSRMERFLIDQKQLLTPSLKILEINESHPIIKYIKEKMVDESKKDSLMKLANVMFDQACILDGENLHDSKVFAQSICEYIINSLELESAN